MCAIPGLPAAGVGGYVNEERNYQMIAYFGEGQPEWSFSRAEDGMARGGHVDSCSQELMIANILTSSLYENVSPRNTHGIIN